MNVANLGWLTQGLIRYGVAAKHITIKGKDSMTLSITVADEDVPSLRKMTDEFRLEVRMTIDQFLPNDEYRFQLTIPGVPQ